MKELNSVSQAARDARRRLEETLAMARDAELELRSKMGLNKIQVRYFITYRVYKLNPSVFQFAISAGVGARVALLSSVLLHS